MKTLFLSFCVLLILLLPAAATSGKTQSKKLDSMLAKIPLVKNENDRATLYAAISVEYFGTDPAAGIRYGRKALEIGIEKSDNKIQATAYNAIGVNFEARSSYDSALHYYSLALQLAERNGIVKQTPNILGNIANVYFYQGNYTRALDMHKKALKISEAANNDTALALTEGNMGICYSQLSLLPEALTCFFNAVKLSEKLGDSAGIAVNYVNIGTVFLRQSNYNKAFDYYNKALQMNLRIGDKRNIAASYGNIGLIYAARNDYNRAIEYQQKAMSIHAELDDQNNIANDLVNLSDVYSKQARYAEAIACLQKASAIAATLGSELTVATNKGYIGAIYLAMGKQASGRHRTDLLKQAEDSISAGIQATRPLNDLATLASFYKTLAETQELTGDYKNCAINRARYINLNDSVFSQSNQDRINNIERERESALTEKELKIKDLEIAKKKRDTTITVLIAILLGGTTIWAVRNFRSARNSNMILTEEKKRHIEQIEQQNKALLDIAYTQSHNVRGPVSTIMGLVSLYNYDNPADPDNKELIEGVASVTEKLDSIVKEVVDKVNQLEKDKPKNRDAQERESITG